MSQSHPPPILMFLQTDIVQPRGKHQDLSESHPPPILMFLQTDIVQPKIKTNRVHHHLYMFLPLNIVKSPKKHTFHFAAFYQLLQSKFVFSGSLRRCSHPNALLARIHKVHKGAKQWHSWNNTGHCLQRFVSEVNSAKASSSASDHLPRALIITKVHWAKDGLWRE